MTSEGARLRAEIGHPVIDADGHWLEYGPVVSEAMRKIGGDAAVRAMCINGERVGRALRMTPAERHRESIAQEAFWGAPTKNARDRATAMMPRLLYERLDEFGIDFAVLFPTLGLGLPRVNDAEVRLAGTSAGGSRPHVAVATALIQYTTLGNQVASFGTATSKPMTASCNTTNGTTPR